MTAAAPTPRDVVHREGTARLHRFRRADDRPAEAGLPILLIPSVINRWYVLDLRPGASVVEALVAAGFDVFCLDWGAPEDEDRYLEWDDLSRRIARCVRVVLRETGASQLGLLGFSIGGTLASIHAAQHPQQVAALVNLAGPIDFSLGGALADLTHPRWFDADAITASGNLSAAHMQSGFVALRPTSPLARVVALADQIFEPEAHDAFQALEQWLADSVAFPAAAYATYVKELYQQNALVAGRHRVLGAPVDLARIRCPVLVVGADRDYICPLPAARALLERTSSVSREVLEISGEHVGSVVGPHAARVLYPKLVSWFGAQLRGPPRPAPGGRGTPARPASLSPPPAA